MFSWRVGGVSTTGSGGMRLCISHILWRVGESCHICKRAREETVQVFSRDDDCIIVIQGWTQSVSWVG